MHVHRLAVEIHAPGGSIHGWNRLLASSVSGPLPSPRSPACLSAISRPEIAAMSAVIDPITFGVVFQDGCETTAGIGVVGPDRGFGVRQGGTSVTARRPYYSGPRQLNRKRRPDPG